MTGPLPGPRVRLGRGEAGYPAALERLGPDAPESLEASGALEILGLPLLGLLSSVRVPGEAALAAYDLARDLRDAAVPVIGGFQAPVERDCLDFLLRGTQPVVVVPARGLAGMRAPPAWRVALDEGRLLLLSPFPPGRRRPDAAMAAARNRVVAALARRVLVVHATPGGRMHRLVVEALGARTPVLCPDLPCNHDLVVMGARPVGPGAPLPV